MIPPDADTNVSKLAKVEELKGKLGAQDAEDKLMRSVMENDKKIIDKGKFVESALNQGINSFTPDLMFEQLVNDYKLTKNLYGETILRQLCGYEPDYIEKNLQIPEFQRVLKQNIENNLKNLKKENLLDKEYNLTEKSIELAALVMYTKELDNIIPKGIRGERLHKKKSHYGSREEVNPFKKGDRYKDLALKKSVKTAIRRNHRELQIEDLKVFERQSKGRCNIIYGIDASGSMKGGKISSAKKAGIALAYKAIKEKDKVGLIVFGKDIVSFVEPTLDFSRLLKSIVKVKASSQTDIVKTIEKATELFGQEDVTKHLLLLTDALPTAGKDPEKETLQALATAKNAGITTSMIGINLDKKGKKFAEKVVEISNGKLYIVKDLETVDKIVLQDYYSVA